MSERMFQVHGLCCGSEVKTLKQEVGPRVGGEQNLAFDILQSRMTVLVDAEQASDERVIEAVRRAGLDAELWDQPQSKEHPGFWQRHGRAVLAAGSGVLLMLAFVLHAVLVAHARRTLDIIRQNIAFALGLKALFVLLTLFGLATLWMAIAADMGASLVVIFNGLRLLRNTAFR